VKVSVSSRGTETAADSTGLPTGVPQLSLRIVMATYDDAVADFLAQKRIAVAGVSRSPGAAANFVFRNLPSARAGVAGATCARTSAA
jgi:hypothetical protein